jgi:hypothetical protein
MPDLEKAHDFVSRHMAHHGLRGRQAEPDAEEVATGRLSEELLRLPLASCRIDPETERLVVGLDLDSAKQEREHRSILKAALGGTEVEVEYCRILRDNAPSKTAACRPIWGGVRMNTTGTVNLPLFDATGQPGTILSGHVVGPPGAAVGQPAQTDTYGQVTVNPPLGNRWSDSAFARVTNHRIQITVDVIWAVPDFAYRVIAKANSGSTEAGLTVYMQGAHTVPLSEGVLLQRGVTITDARGTLQGQLLASYPAEGGDSGAPIFFPAGHSTQEVIYLGIHVGRIQNSNGSFTSFYSPWESIRAELGLP